MRSIVMKGVIRAGQVEVAEPINLPDGSEVTITGHADIAAEIADDERPMSPHEIAATLAAMARVEPFDMSDDERASADAWEKTVNDYSVANADRGIEDVLR